jgi:hypothetical protein
MIQRAFIHVAGPARSGKTSFVEALLGAGDGPILVARCLRDDRLRRLRESSPRSHRELERYRRAGAYDSALFTVPRQNANSIDFYESRLMLNYSRAVVLEGANPAGNADLVVFVAPAPLAGETLYVRHQRDVAAAQRAKADAWDELLRRPDGMAIWLEDVMGLPLGNFARNNPRLAEDVRSRMLEGIAQVRDTPPRAPTEHWAVSERFHGIEAAGLVVVNIRDSAERPAAEQLLMDLVRLRKDDALFNDILGTPLSLLGSRGTRTPITAVVADLADPRDAGRKKAVARVRRCMRSRAR